MFDFASIDPQTTAENLAKFDVAKLQVQLNNQKRQLASQKNALKLLKTSLSDFRTALTDLNKVNDGVLQNSAKTSAEGIADFTVSSNAGKGSYAFFVEKLATAHQVAFEGLTDESLAGDKTGTLSLTIGDKKITIDMTGINSVTDLAEAINAESDNPGVTASVVRTDGKAILMLSSNETGKANEIKIDSTGTAFQGASANPISAAQDLQFRMGDKDSGLLITRGSNTVDDLIKGVKIEFKQSHKSSEPALKVDIGADSTQSKEQMNKFIAGYNKLIDDIDSLTKRPSVESKDKGPKDDGKGAFAGDSGIMALKSQLNNLIRQQFDGMNMTEFGITADKEGHLKLDSKRFDDVLKTKPDTISKMFNGQDGLIKALDKSLDNYLSSTSGQIKMRQDTLDQKQTQISDKEKSIEHRYNQSFSRYLKQFTNLQKAMQSMGQTMNMFGIS